MTKPLKYPSVELQKINVFVGKGIGMYVFSNKLNDYLLAKPHILDFGAWVCDNVPVHEARSNKTWSAKDVEEELEWPNSLILTVSTSCLGGKAAACQVWLSK